MEHPIAILTAPTPTPNLQEHLRALEQELQELEEDRTQARGEADRLRQQVFELAPMKDEIEK